MNATRSFISTSTASEICRVGARRYLTRSPFCAASESCRLSPGSKITIGEMRSSGPRRLPVYCANYRCTHRGDGPLGQSGIATCSRNYPNSRSSFCSPMRLWHCFQVFPSGRSDRGQTGNPPDAILLLAWNDRERGHSPKNANDPPNIRGKQRGLHPDRWPELEIACPCRHSRHK